MFWCLSPIDCCSSLPSLANSLCSPLPTVPRLKPQNIAFVLFCRWAPPLLFIVNKPPADVPFATTASRSVPCGFAINWTANANLQCPLTARDLAVGPSHKTGKETGENKESFEYTTNCGTSPWECIAAMEVKKCCECDWLPTTRVGDGHEVTLGVTGRKAGVTKKQSSHSRKSMSRLCRAMLSERFHELCTMMGRECTIANSSSRVYHDQWQRLLQPPSPFAGWIRKPSAGMQDASVCMRCG